MNVSIEEKKAEAVKRLKEMNVFEYYVQDFSISGRVQVSEPPLGALYWLDKNKDAGVIEYIKEFENGGENLVYLVVRGWYQEIGQLDHLFYVSDYPEEWEDAHNDIKENIALVNVYSIDDPTCCEIGSISFTRTSAGGILRKC